MTNERIKEILLDLEGTEIDFFVTQTGKSSKKVNGLYYPETHEILLHNKNFEQDGMVSDNLLIYTAIHEYTHHKLSEELFSVMGVNAIYNAKSHTQKFWAKFDALLTIAEQKGYYKLSLETSKELQELTEKIKTEYLEKNGQMMREFGELLIRAHTLCKEANIRYEDYIDRILCLSKAEATSLKRVAQVPIDTKIGYDNMKTLSKIDDADERKLAQNNLLAGHSVASVRQMLTEHMKKKKEDEDDEGDESDKDEKKLQKLTAEKNRIERAITNLEKRLKIVETALSAIG